MVSEFLKRYLPAFVKHPLLKINKWYWVMNGLPSQSSMDIKIFKEVLSASGGKHLRVLEWGSGASTIYYPKFLRSIGRQFQWHAIENSGFWYEKGLRQISKFGLTGRVHIHCSEFPPFWELPGYSGDTPIPPPSYTISPNQVKYVELPEELEEQFDVVIVDGRFRRRCLLVSSKVLAPNGIVILHDAQRTHYHSSLSIYPNVQFLETGKLPGMRFTSTIALCGFGDDSLVRRITGKYGADLQIPTYNT